MAAANINVFSNTNGSNQISTARLTSDAKSLFNTPSDSKRKIKDIMKIQTRIEDQWSLGQPNFHYPHN